MVKLKPLVLMMVCVSGYSISHAAEAPVVVESDSSSQASNVTALEAIRIVASADASANGLMEAFAGGQVATGGRVGVFGNQKNLDNPFSLTSYTNQYSRASSKECWGCAKSRSECTCWARIW